MKHNLLHIIQEHPDLCRKKLGRKEGKKQDCKGCSGYDEKCPNYVPLIKYKKEAESGERNQEMSLS